MTDLTENIKLMLLETGRIKPGQDLLIISDTHKRARSIANTFTDVAKSIGIQTVLVMMDPRQFSGQEPPPCVAVAMLKVDAIIEFCDGEPITHTNARRDASAAGIKFFLLHGGVAEDFLSSPISLDELMKIKAQTEKLTAMLTSADSARVTSPFGTDITMSLKDREGLPVCPFAEKGHETLIDYAEAAISPVEGTTQGLVVVDAGIRGGWGRILQAPLSFQVKAGRALVDTVTSENAEEANGFKEILQMAENADNCAAELGIGTAHTVPRKLRGDNMRDYSMAGNIHLAIGRNNDIGGQTWSEVHLDILITRANVELGGTRVVENGQLNI
ncbi:aminopeptidase [Chloroflexota bacterium]